MTWFQKPMLGVPLDWEHPFNKDLALHLAMNEGHGDKVQDLSMNGNHGTLKNMAFPPTAASGWNPGRTGVGLNFDGSNDYVNCGNGSSLNITDAITVSLLINSDVILNAGSGYTTIISKEGDFLGYSIMYHNSGYIQFGMGTGAANKVVAFTTTLNANQNYNIMGTFDGGVRKIYVDGIEKTTVTESFTIGTTANALYIGDWISGGRNFNGFIDQVRIHNRAWSAKEVRDYYINPWQVYLDEDGM